MSTSFKPQAVIEDLDCFASRGLELAAAMSLSLGLWVRSGHAVLIISHIRQNTKLEVMHLLIV